MINFVIVEDNNHYRKRVVDIIITYMMGNKVEFKISEFDDYNIIIFIYWILNYQMQLR